MADKTEVKCAGYISLVFFDDKTGEAVTLGCDAKEVRARLLARRTPCKAWAIRSSRSPKSRVCDRIEAGGPQ